MRFSDYQKEWQGSRQTVVQVSKLRPTVLKQKQKKTFNTETLEAVYLVSANR